MKSDYSALEPQAQCPLNEENWQAVSPRYKTALRIRLLLIVIALLVGLYAAEYLEPVIPVWWLASPIALCFAYLALVWIPRRVRFTRYLMRELDMHLQTGYWWHKTTSVAVNRIQHLELTQGPIERWLALNTLILYTAGGSQSDLKLPGLDIGIAQQVKAQLLQQIAEEEFVNEEPSNGASA